ncbi:MAG: hypothetical protein Q8L79_18065 [Methylobacter sp.]|uniref:hypothetical protein n=1 Tax=Methylobacter sp. TaxID=2051955 RepID=UPI0027310CA2|nr:hypothetical protein [Methylobacter sp.]MDP1667014.1 hypothetical protein [Methylobacter sp.]
MFTNLKDSIAKLKRDPLGWILEMILKKAVWALIFGWSFLAWPVSTWFLTGWLKLSSFNTLHQIIFGSIIVIAIIFFIILGHVSKYAITSKRENEKLKGLIEAYGIKGFFPYIDEPIRRNEWDTLLKYLKLSQPQNLNILALNGWDTFGSESAPLHDFLMNYKGELRILLIDPECKESELRRSGLQLPENKFKTDYEKTKAFCDALKANNVNVELKLYDQKPIWKMITTESYMWLQHYDKFTHVNKNPVYEIYKDKNKTSLFFPLIEVFIKRWKHDNNKIVKLGSNNQN